LINTKKAINSINKGGILIFQPGQREIKNLIPLLKQNTGSNVLVLPYYSEMENDKRIYVKDIGKNLSNSIKPQCGCTKRR
jgi:HrpA-like RNA helicase